MPLYLPPDIAEGRAEAGGTTYLSMPGMKAVTQITTVTLSANVIRYEPRIVPTPITIDALVIEVTTANGATSTARLGIYNADGDWQPTTLVLDAGTVATDTTTGAGVRTLVLGAPLALAAGRYLLAINTDATPALRNLRGGFDFALTTGANAQITAMTVSVAYAAFASPGAAWAATAAATSFNNTIYMRVLNP